MSLRPETERSTGTALSKVLTYRKVYEAVSKSKGLIAGALHKDGAHCALGEFWQRNSKAALLTELTEEIAAVNDSVPWMSRRERRAHVLRWLRNKLHSYGYRMRGRL